jgi:hypothetical protein
MNPLDVAHVPTSLTTATPKWLLSLHDWNDTNHSKLSNHHSTPPLTSHHSQATVATVALFAEADAASTNSANSDANAMRKSEFVRAVVRALSSVGADSVVNVLGADAVFKTLRILSRDKLAVDALLTPTFAAWLLDVCELHVGADASAVPAFSLDHLRTESWALLVNLTVNAAAAPLLAELAARRSHRVTLARLQNSGDADFSLFSRYRLLLQLAAKREDVRVELVDEHVLPLLAAKLRALLRDKSSADIDAALRAMSIDELSYCDDLFRCCFIVTVPWGPAAQRGAKANPPPQPTMVEDDQAALFEILEYSRLTLRCEPITAAERAASLELSRVHGVRAAAVSCLLNTPIGHRSVELLQRGQEATGGSDVKFLARHLDNLTLAGADVPRDQLVTMLMLVHRMVRAYVDARIELREIVFPAASYGRDVLRAGVQVPYANENNLTNRLIKLMSEANPAVSYFAQDLLFALCEENSDEFTRVVGFGSAAGLLAMRGFLKMPSDPLSGQATEATSSSSSTSSTASTAQQSDEAARLLRQFNANPDEESEDARAIRQGRALHDLEKLGVLKMMRKGDEATTPAAPATTSSNRCAGCGGANAVMRCARCKAVFYCSPKCQRSDWSQHRRHCKATK